MKKTHGWTSGSRKSFSRRWVSGPVAMALTAAMALQAPATEIIVSSDYSTATSTEDTTQMFRDLNLQGAEESIVLLENKNNALPLASGTNVTFLEAGSYILSGSGSGGTNATDENKVTPAQGLEADPDINLVHDVYDEQSDMPMFPGMEPQTEAETEELAKDFTEFLNDESKAAEYASDSDTAIVWISRQPGEGNNRYATKGDWYLSDDEEKTLEYATKYFDKTIVVLNLPSIDMDWVSQYDVDAVLLYGYAGAQGGTALANILSGKTNPSGKTADTFASIDSYPSTVNFQTRALAVDYFTMEDDSLRHLAWWLDTPNPAYGYDNGDWIRPYDEYYFTKYEEGIYNGYRYFETFEDIVNEYNATASEEDQQEFKVYYDFGYGLSYTDFDVEITDSTLPAEVPTVDNDQQISVTATVTNTGDVAGKDVVEIYVGAPDGVVENPKAELVAFAKTDLLEPGQSQKVTVTFDAYDMADWYEEEAAYILNAGTYHIYVGDSLKGAYENSVDYELTTDGDYTVVAQGSNLAGPDQEGGTYDQYLDAFPEIALTELTKYDYTNTRPTGEAGVLKTDTQIQDHVVDGETTRDRFQAALTNEDGSADYISPDPSMTYTEYYNFLVDQAEDAIADAQQLYTDEGKAQYQLIDVYNGDCTMDEFLDQWTDIELVSYVVGAGRVGQLYTGTTSDAEGVDSSDGLQGNERLGVPSFSLRDGPNQVGTENGATTTAWVCGTNRAQTWNEELIYQIGQATGYEALAGSTEIDLGPALCIHRNPLCGRNYEYFSEDPVLSGVMASALTRGIQESGCGVSLKHFAANQSEGENNDRWNKLDSVVSERALREIYLKAFEITVKTAHPYSIMTAYNMVNGKYASCADELMQIAKEEWGFDGISMTDWSGDWGNPITMLKTATDVAMPSNRYMLSYLYNALQVTANENRGLSYREAAGDFDTGATLTREDLEKCATNLLNTTMKMRVFADYAGIEWTADDTVTTWYTTVKE